MTGPKRWVFCFLSAATLAVAALQWTSHHRMERPTTTERPLLPASMPYLT